MGAKVPNHSKKGKLDPKKTVFKGGDHVEPLPQKAKCFGGKGIRRLAGSRFLGKKLARGQHEPYDKRAMDGRRMCQRKLMITLQGDGNSTEKTEKKKRPLWGIIYVKSYVEKPRNNARENESDSGKGLIYGSGQNLL